MTHDDLLTAFEVLYIRSNDDEYQALTDDAAWSDFIATCRALAPSAPQIDAIAAPLPLDRYRAFCNAILTPGIPGSVLPVESIYKPWSEIISGGIGQNTGYYLGDHAQHIIALCDQLHIAIPQEFSATPDHLALLLELFAFMRANAPAQAWNEFSENHLDWLPTYEEALAEREALEPDQALAQSIRFYEQLTGLLE